MLCRALWWPLAIYELVRLVNEKACLIFLGVWGRIVSVVLTNVLCALDHWPLDTDRMCHPLFVFSRRQFWPDVAWQLRAVFLSNYGSRGQTSLKASGWPHRFSMDLFTCTGSVHSTGDLIQMEAMWQCLNQCARVSLKSCLDPAMSYVRASNSLAYKVP